MNVCPICEASLSHHTWSLVYSLYMYHVFHWLAKKQPTKQTGTKTNNKTKRPTAPILKPTYDQKSETFSWSKWKGTTLVITRLVNKQITIKLLSWEMFQCELLSSWRTQELLWRLKRMKTWVKKCLENKKVYMNVHFQIPMLYIFYK